MPNYSMMEKLKNGEALDVGVIGTPLDGFPGVWELQGFTENVDYCDAESELWIYTIGRDKQTGVFYAAADTRFMDNPKFDCVWLR